MEWWCKTVCMSLMIWDASTWKRSAQLYAIRHYTYCKHYPWWPLTKMITYAMLCRSCALLYTSRQVIYRSPLIYSIILLVIHTCWVHLGFIKLHWTYVTLIIHSAERHCCYSCHECVRRWMILLREKVRWWFASYSSIKSATLHSRLVSCLPSVKRSKTFLRKSLLCASGHWSAFHHLNRQSGFCVSHTYSSICACYCLKQHCSLMHTRMR